jgi:hypothetical protein
MAAKDRTPPWLRTARPGKQTHNVQVTAAVGGNGKSNASCPPLSVTDGKGVRAFLKSRSVRIGAPKVNAS